MVTNVTIHFVTINAMTKLELEKFLPYRLNRIASVVSRGFRAVYGRHHDLTIPEWRVLATLGQFEEMSAREIGLHSSMHKTKVSRAVRALEGGVGFNAGLATTTGGKKS
ncbi:MarR family winged helix-turn-helix transcriptional regulator [Microvirga alba]|uniref:MarR family winged helix-turn-helix transcriptional regulator n=1 Tax=Microvirga alba TaxID=2791025 RepID=UPI002D219AE2|nr:MarR family winged helix-turn-helix transcriptional regulator [Microvirga alba]